jgi:hypothetical protein
MAFNRSKADVPHNGFVRQEPANSRHSAKESLTESISYLFTSSGPLLVAGIQIEHLI